MISLSSSAKERLVKELQRVIPQLVSDIEPRMEVITKGVRRYEAKRKNKTYPLGSMGSNLHIPFLSIVYDSIKSRAMNSLFSSSKILSVQALVDDKIEGLLNPDNGQQMRWFDIADALESYFLYETGPSGQVRYRDWGEKLWDEGCMTGTGVPVCSWEIEKELDFPRGARRMSDAIESISFDNIRLDVCPIEDLLFPRGYSDPYMENVPIIGHRFTLRPSELRSKVLLEGWDKDVVERLIELDPTADRTRTDKDYADIVGEKSEYEFDEIGLCESWMRFPLDGKREYKILVTHFIDDPSMILNISGWPFEHRKTKFCRAFRYIRRRNRFMGMGIPERLECVDEALSTIVNQIIDGATIANIPVWSVDENIQGVRDFRDLYPGAVVKRGDDPNSIMPMKGIGPGPDLFEAWNILRDIGERVSHVTDYSLGRESTTLGKEGTATGIMALLQETGSHFDSINRDFRTTADNTNHFWLMNIAQRKPIARMAQVLGRKKAMAVIAAISSLNSEQIQKRLSIRVAFSNSAATEELARQEENAKFMMMGEYYKNLFILSDQVFQNPAKAGLAREVAIDSDRRIKKWLEAYGDSDTADTLPGFEKFLPTFLQYAQQMNSGGEIQTGGAEGMRGKSKLKRVA